MTVVEPRPGLPARLIGLAFRGVSRVAPALAPHVQRGLIRAGYGVISTVVAKNTGLTFMNFGYAPLEPAGAGIALRPEDEDNAYAIQLYHRVVGGRDLKGKDVLEVGSGLGGGASFIARYLEPRSVTGVDFAASAVAFCRRQHCVARLVFHHGDAQHLPFAANSFDVVVNVESSHCYPAFERFLDEVVRVLRPEGELLFADLRPRDKVAELREELQRALLVVEEERITANVFRALELYSDRRTTLIDTKAPSVLRKALRNFAAVKGTPTFESFRRGELEYVRFVARKR